MTTFSPADIDRAARNVADLLAYAIEHGPGHRALVVYDRRSELNEVLTEAYRRALPEGTFIDFDDVGPDPKAGVGPDPGLLVREIELIHSDVAGPDPRSGRVSDALAPGPIAGEGPDPVSVTGPDPTAGTGPDPKADTGPDPILAAFQALSPGDLVVLIQTTSFRLNDYRIRMELFKLGLKVIEHLHLSRMPGEQGLVYIDALAYDPAYFRGTGHALKAQLDAAHGGVVDSGDGAQLVFASAFEEAKLNIGDYSAMKNVGGLFPIGEVFTEARDLEAVHGRVRVFVFGDTSFRVNRPAKPITMIVERGRVTGAIDSTPAFDEMLSIIRAHEGEVWVRELGFGMNRAFSASRTVDDIGTYERMCGVHLSLGAKHGQYQKPQFKRKDARYHVDVFAVTEGVYLDGERIYADGAWRV